MDQARKLRWLRIYASATCLIVCGLLIVLWVRSYTWYDHASALYHGSGLAASSWGGRLTFSRSSNSHPVVEQQFITVDTDHRYKAGIEWDTLWTFTSQSIVIPHWLPAVLLAAFSTIPWLRFRFTLRTLLVATTLIAVVLGLVVWMVR